MLRRSRTAQHARQVAVVAAALAAGSFPSLLAYNVSPSPTVLNQALAFASWAVFAAAVAPRAAVLPAARAAAPLLAVFGLLVLAAVWSTAHEALPATLALSIGLTVTAAALVATAGSAAPADDAAAPAFTAFAWGWFAAGMINAAIAFVQVFAPDLPDGSVIARSSLAGRAVGNLRQPNHLSSLLVWSCVAVVALHELGRLATRWAGVALALLVFAILLTASRTGLVSVGVLAAWALLDRRLSRPGRWLLLATPLLYALAWWFMTQWAASAPGHTFGGAQRVAEGFGSGSRMAVLRDTLALIRMHPWAGVGLGEFNFAWTLTAFPQRSTAFFDHTHNLPLQLLVELGLPLGGAVLALLAAALVLGVRRAWAASGARGVAQRCALLFVLLIGLHSMGEYPLWYAYFLLPAAWAWGCALQRPGAAAPAQRPWLPIAAAAVVAGAALAVADYARVAVIFSADSTVPLARRIETGQRSWLFGHHGDYAAVTSGDPPADPRAFDRATHYLLDTRLMVAWAKALAARGEVDAARHLAARLREFDKADAADFFAPCDAPGAVSAELPFQCQPPQQPHGWQDFLPK